MASKRPRLPPDVQPLWCELTTASGFGDRLMDAWAACAIALSNGRPLRLYVQPQGLAFQGFVGDYDWANVMLPNCSVHYQSDSKLHGFQITPRSYFGLIGDRIVLRHERRWATTTLREICHDRAHYVSTECSEQTMRNAYKQVVTETKIRSARTLPKGKYVGVHVRRKDKLSERSINYHDMSPETFVLIEQRLLAFVEMLASRGQRDIFLCGDDAKYNLDLSERLQARGAEVLVSSFSALEDHVCLSCCKIVVQCTLYSTFSMSAAMIAQVPLINFTEVHKTMLCEWVADGILRFEKAGTPIPLPRESAGVPREWILADDLSAIARSLLDKLIAANIAPETVADAFKQVYSSDVFSESADNGFLRVGTICGLEMLTRATRAFLDTWKVLGAEVQSVAALPPQHGHFEVIATLEVSMVAKDRLGRPRYETIVRHFKIDLATQRIVHEKTFLIF